MPSELSGDLTDNPAELLQAAMVTHRTALVKTGDGRAANTIALVVHARLVGYLAPGQSPVDAVLVFDQPVRQLELTFEESELDSLAYAVMAARREFARRRRDRG